MGKGEKEILTQIFSILGNPNEDRLPGWTNSKNYKAFKYSEDNKCKLRKIFPAHYFDSRATLSNQGIDLLERLLYINPVMRISASESLQHPWFQEYPLPKINVAMPYFPCNARANLDIKRKNKVFIDRIA